MKVLKYLFLLLLIIFIGGAVYFSLIEGNYYITEKKVIKAPPSLLYEQVADFKNWKNWNPSVDDNTINITLGEQTNGIDGNYSFTSDQSSGSMVITNLKPNKSITTILSSQTDFTTSASEVMINLSPVADGTEVIWTIKGEHNLKNKVNHFISGYNLEEDIRSIYKKGLENLQKHVLIEMNKYDISNPGLVDYGGGYILYKSTSTHMDKFSSEMGTILQDIMKFMQEENISMYGMPISIYEKFDYSNNSVIFSAAIPVRDRVILDSNSSILCTYIEPTRAVKVTLTGTYDHLQEAWKKAELYMAEQGHINGVQAPFEIYKTDPALTPNPAANVTEIYLPIISND